MSAWTDAGFPDRLPLQSFRAVTETLIAACRERNYNNNFSVAAAISWVEYSIEQMDTNKRLLMDSIDDMLAAVASLYVAWDGADISQPASLPEFCAAFGIAYVGANRLSTVFSRAWILCRYRLLNCLRYIRTTQVATGYRRKEMIVPQSGSASEREYSGSTGNVPMCQNYTYDGNQYVTKQYWCTVPGMIRRYRLLYRLDFLSDPNADYDDFGTGIPDGGERLYSVQVPANTTEAEIIPDGFFTPLPAYRPSVMQEVRMFNYGQVGMYGTFGIIDLHEWFSFFDEEE